MSVPTNGQTERLKSLRRILRRLEAESASRDAGVREAHERIERAELADVEPRGST